MTLNITSYVCTSLFNMQNSVYGIELRMEKNGKWNRKQSLDMMQIEIKDQICGKFIFGGEIMLQKEPKLFS